MMKRIGVSVGLVAACMLAGAQGAGAQTEYEFLASATNVQVREFLGTQHAKVAYVNWYNGLKKLHYIDFSEGDGDPVVHRIPAAALPTAPILSPDGRWVVFASAEGTRGEHLSPVAQRSSVYICKLEEGAEPVLLVSDSAYEPRFLYDGTPGKAEGKLTIVYPTLAPSGSWAGVGRTMLLDIDTTGGAVTKGTPRVLFEHGGYAGGLSTDGRYLCTGGDWAVMMDLQSNATMPDTVGHPYSGQNCNPSITSSTVRPDVMLYLDFGGFGDTPPYVNDGNGWLKWEMIQMSASNGDWVRWYKYPTDPVHTYDYYDSTEGHVKSSSSRGWNTFVGARWHHEEWSNHPYYAASAVQVDRSYRLESWGDNALWRTTSHQERLYLINLHSGAYLEVLRRKNMEFNPDIDLMAAGLHWPTLWVDIPEDFQEQSDWLPVVEPTGSRRAAGAVPRFVLNRGTVRSSQPIRGVAVYTLLGSLVERNEFAQPTLSAQLKPMPAGIYFVRITTASGSRGTLRWTVRD